MFAPEFAVFAVELGGDFAASSSSFFSIVWIVVPLVTAMAMAMSEAKTFALLGSASGKRF